MVNGKVNDGLAWVSQAPAERLPLDVRARPDYYAAWSTTGLGQLGYIEQGYQSPLEDESEGNVYKVDIEKCDGCATCIDACPSGAISLVDSKAIINEDECVDCGACGTECPNEAIAPV